MRRAGRPGQDDSDDLEWLTFDKHPCDVADNVKDKAGDEEGDKAGNHNDGVTDALSRAVPARACERSDASARAF